MGQRRRRLFGMSVLLLALSACGREPVEPAPLDFDTDPRILRGVWVGEEAGVDLVLDLDASNPDADGYTITGTFRLGDEAAVPFSARVSVPVVTSAASPETQTSEGCGAFLADIDGPRGQLWEVCGFPPDGSPPRFSLTVIDWRQTAGPVGHTFMMTKQVDETPLPVDDDAPIATDRERYTPEDFGDYVTYTVRASYTNTTGESVYLAPCGYEPPLYGLERFDGDAWRTSGYGIACPAVPAPAVEVAPGGTFDTTIEIAASRAPNAFPQFGTDLVPGVHRFVFAVVTGVDDEGFPNDDLLPLEQRVSNALELSAP